MKSTRWAAGILALAILAGTAGANEVTWLGANVGALDAYAREHWIEWVEEDQVWDDDEGGWVTVPAHWAWKDGFDAGVMDDFVQGGGASVDVSAYDPDTGSYLLWDLNRVPGTGDTAVINWDILTANMATVDGDRVIDRSIILGGDFNPDRIVHVSTGNVSSSAIVVAKHLALTDISWTSGRTSAARGILDVQNGASLTLTGETPFTWGSPQGGWHVLGLQGPDAALRFDAPSVILDPLAPPGYSGYGLTMRGTGGKIEFVAEEGTINLGNPGDASYSWGARVIAAPAILGGPAQTLRVRSDQTWSNPTRTSQVLVRGQDENDGALIESIDGGRLDNMGNVPIIFHAGAGRSRFWGGEIAGGTYQSFLAMGECGYVGGTYEAILKLAGDVTLTGGVVIAGDPDPETGYDAFESEDYSIEVRAMNTLSIHIDTGGYDLTTARGILLRPQNTTLRGGNQERSRLMAAGSTLDIGGDLFFESTNFGAGTLESGTLAETRHVGFQGDATTVLTLRGSFSANVRSPTGNGFHLSTVNLIGGTNPTANTWEVGSDPADVFGPDTYAVGAMNIGTATEPGHIRLVNAFINDGDPDNTAKTGEGEILLAGRLNIHAGSTLDLDGQSARVETALWIDATGTLDLNTGRTLEIGEVVDAFWGVGDQSDDWAAFAGRVVDIGNPGFTFVPVVIANSPENTYWQAIPEPGTVGLFGLGLLALGALRGRREPRR
jgi:hypothetical protein